MGYRDGAALVEWVWAGDPTRHLGWVPATVIEDGRVCADMLGMAQPFEGTDWEMALPDLDREAAKVLYSAGIWSAYEVSARYEEARRALNGLALTILGRILELSKEE